MVLFHPDTDRRRSHHYPDRGCGYVWVRRPRGGLLVALVAVEVVAVAAECNSDRDNHHHIRWPLLHGELPHGVLAPLRRHVAMGFR